MIIKVPLFQKFWPSADLTIQNEFNNRNLQIWCA